MFIPADLEPAKVDHALAYGATVVPIDGTYDDVNRLCLEVADETGWGFVNINLRPFYAEGSKTLAYEIAESLGWRSPDVVVGPVASGAMFTRVARGFEELAELGLIERRPIRFVGGQAAGCAPVATAWAAGTDVIEPGPRAGHDRPLARHRQPGRRALRGRAGARQRRLDRGDRRRGDRRGDPRRRPARGDLPGDGRRRDARRGRRRAPTRRDPRRRRGRRAAHRQRAQDAGRAHARAGRTAASPRPDPASPASRRSIRPSLAAFEAWLEGGVMSTVRIPPTLRTSTGGAKLVDVPGGTVREVIAGLVAAHPGLESQLLAQDGDLNRFVNAFLNDTDVRHLQALDTPVGEATRWSSCRRWPAAEGPRDGLGAVEGPPRGRRSGRRRPRCRPTGGRAPGSTSSGDPATDMWVIAAGTSISDSTPPSDSARVNSRVAFGDRDRPLGGGAHRHRPGRAGTRPSRRTPG